MKVFNCSLCNGKLSEPKINLGKTPLANAFTQAPVVAEEYPLELCRCTICGHYQLNEFVEPEKMFKEYVYVAGTSPVNVLHFKQYAEHMISKFKLKPQSKVLDIASNDGTLLQQFKDLNMSILGIDPATNIAKLANDAGIPTLNEFFTDQYADTVLETYGKFDLITANNVLAHIPDINGFVKGVSKLLNDNGIFSFEVSYFMDVVDYNLFDTCYHEHYYYHHLKPLYSFFLKHGLRLFDVEHLSNHGGSIRVFVKKNNACIITDGLEHVRLNELNLKEINLSSQVSRLQQDIYLLKTQLSAMLEVFNKAGKSIYVYGYPAKATTLLYALDIDEKFITLAIDDNPLKQKLFSPGKNILIYDDSVLSIGDPDYILILAWNFSESIISKCKKNGYKGNFIIPLPELKVIE